MSDPQPCNREQISDAKYHALGLCLDGRSEKCWCEYIREQWERWVREQWMREQPR